MSELLIAIFFATTLFFSATTVGIFFMQKKKNKKRLDAISQMTETAKASQNERKNQLTTIDLVQKEYPTMLQTALKQEVSFYGDMVKTLSDNALDEAPNIPNKTYELLTPYLSMIKELAENTGANPEELAELEKRYKEKIDENEQLNNKLSELKKEQSNTKETASEAEISEAETSNSSNNEAEIKFIKSIIHGLAKLVDADVTVDNVDELKKLEAQYKHVYVMIEEKAYAFNNEDEDFDQNAALIEQLRFEKLELNKKIHQITVVLSQTYNKYAELQSLAKVEDETASFEDIYAVIQKEAEGKEDAN